MITNFTLTKDKAEAADMLRACVRAFAYQLADESSRLQRAPDERESWSSAKADGKIRGHGRRTADANASGRNRRGGTRQSRRRQQHRDARE